MRRMDAARRDAPMMRRGSGWRARYAALALVALAWCLAGCGVTLAPLRPLDHSRAPLSVVVMGASDAWGVGSHDPDRLNWPALMAADLPQPVHLINLGAPGVTLARAMRDELPVALDSRPQVVLIWLVVNDFIDHVPLDNYILDLRQTLALIRQRDPRASVMVGNAPDLTQIPFFSGWEQNALRVQVNAWNAAIAQVCQATGDTVVNLYALWGQLADHPEYISADGLHPSDQGAQALATVFSAAIIVSRDGSA